MGKIDTHRGHSTQQSRLERAHRLLEAMDDWEVKQLRRMVCIEWERRNQLPQSEVYRRSTLCTDDGWQDK